MIVYLKIYDKETADALEKAAEGVGLMFREMPFTHNSKRVLELRRNPYFLRSKDDELSRVSGRAAAGAEETDPIGGAILGFDTVGEGE
jgi:hypothetical protein